MFSGRHAAGSGAIGARSARRRGLRRAAGDQAPLYGQPAFGPEIQRYDIDIDKFDPSTV
ncbi:hypothetical protein [Burkholderia pseudomultivorans]|uniref:hypothetical protein n=1 Tax=Burkholderia pseudomultivorans TaxID=1207504 RepID=UPI000A4E8878|nr:hypothetical protein [Burkholderia pseudomultivorans]